MKRSRKPAPILKITGIHLIGKARYFVTTCATKRYEQDATHIDPSLARFSPTIGGVVRSWRRLADLSAGGLEAAPLTLATLDIAAQRGRDALAERPDFIAELEHCGRERALLYKLMALTGLRVNEARTLTVGQCELAGRTPHITLNAADEKNREGNTLPLPWGCWPGSR